MFNRRNLDNHYRIERVTRPTYLFIVDFFEYNVKLLQQIRYIKVLRAPFFLILLI